jgi:chromosome segregation ATPase
MVREQYEEAAAECARLQAGGEPAVTRVVAQPRTAEREQGAAAADHAEPEHLKAQAEELKRRLDEAATLLASEHARSEKLKGSLNEVERELAETRDALDVERARSGALEIEAENFRAELQQLQGEAARTSEDSAEGWRTRVVQLQIDLRRALADNGQLRDEMAGLVRFLDELSAVLSAPAAAAG